MERYLLNAEQIAVIRARCLEIVPTLDEQDAINHRPDKQQLIDQASDTYCNDEIEIDDHAVALCPSDDGCWVAAWLWVHYT